MSNFDLVLFIESRFNGAYWQVLALDRKLNKDGLEVLNLEKQHLIIKVLKLHLNCLITINNSKSDEKKYSEKL